MAEYRNSLRSKRLIRQAFAELMQEKQSIDKITVKEIIDRADISKSTFYSHYQDIYALLEEFEDEILDMLDNAFDEYNAARKMATDMPYIDHVLKNLKENESTYKMILTSNYPVQFIDKLKSYINGRILKDIKLNGLSSNQKIKLMEIDMMTNAFVHLGVDYMRGKVDATFAELSSVINTFLLNVILLCTFYNIVSFNMVFFYYLNYA